MASDAPSAVSRFPDRLETERLILRPPGLRDARAIAKAVNASAAELGQWMPWARDAYGLQDAVTFVEAAVRKLRAEEEFTTVIISRKRRAFVGCCTLSVRDWKVPKFEIGYWLRTDHVGHGYASEATHAVAGFALESLAAARVEIRVDDRNARSWAVAERLGFAWEATFKSNERGNDGSLRDTRIYALFDLDRLRCPPHP